MISKKHVITIGVFAATVLLTGCDWFCCGKKKCCNSKEEIVIIRENDDNIINKLNDEIENNEMDNIEEK
jgi:hypothetical protein